MFDDIFNIFIKQNFLVNIDIEPVNDEIPSVTISPNFSVYVGGKSVLKNTDLSKNAADKKYSFKT